MTNEQLGTLLGAFANYYWSVSLEFVIEKILSWHPELTDKQFRMVLNKCNKDPFWHHCCVLIDGLDEPELVAEHLIAVDSASFDRFIAARTDAPLFECDEETLLRFDKDYLNIPEKDAIIEFGQTELGLDDEWSRQLVQDCVFRQPSSLCDGESWIMSVLMQESFGKIQFRNLEQVRRYRELGNRFYQAFPNPVLRGWKPRDIENPPVLPDDIPERDEDIPNNRKIMDELFAEYGGREEVSKRLMKSLEAQMPKVKKAGPNDPCPCGSGKKYKKCCGRG